jgi:exopolyphosphatase/guanosine-5'-triphosphate,3'-diphosphate pyrophosphatase
VVRSSSLDLGTVRLKELFFDKDDIKGAKAYIDSALDSLGMGANEHIIGVGGTFRALAQIILKTNRHPLDKLHGFSFSAEELVSLGEKIIKAKDTVSLKALGVKRERFDVIKPGTLILLRIVKKVGAKGLTCSGVGVREGLYLSDLLRNNRDTFPANFNPSLTYLIDQYAHNATQRNLRVRLAKTLFGSFAQELALEAEFEKPLLIAAKLAKIGASHHFYSYQKHSHYLAQTALEYGYTHQEIVLISMLMLNQLGKSPNKRYFAKYERLLPSIEIVKKLSSLLALSDALLSHHPSKIDFELSAVKDSLIVTPESGSAYLAQESVQSLSGCSIKIEFRV